MSKLFGALWCALLAYLLADGHYAATFVGYLSAFLILGVCIYREVKK